ncbi:MAG TPA: carboxypeptidase regulatory-like domain-containing protein, partial [Acidobacteriaceae bacterium]|nr:carboxypeptidase regulatory-like domain-containing protein [Acidobacteriaceae bacterium]
MKFVSLTSRTASKSIRFFCSALGTILLLAFAVSAAWAAPITGTVTNLTTKKPAAGDTVTLIRLQQGMQDAGQTTTDAHGHFTLNIADADPMHLVRVTHDKANYFKPAPPGTHTVDVDVYNSAEKVPGVSTEAQVLRIEAQGRTLHVTENFFVKNVSSPPLTQFGPRAYEIYLPRGAQKIAGAALGPGSMPVQSTPVALGPPGDYSFIFPIRPGETRFQASFEMPYSGTMEFPARVAAPVDNFA